MKYRKNDIFVGYVACKCTVSVIRDLEGGEKEQL
jgi:hypothetical protein